MELRDIIASMFIKDQKLRPSCENLLGNKYVILFMSRKLAGLSIVKNLLLGHSNSPSKLVPKSTVSSDRLYKDKKIKDRHKEEKVEANGSFQENVKSHVDESSRGKANNELNKDSGAYLYKGSDKDLCVKNPASATKDHTNRNKMVYRGNLDFAHKWHSENPHKDSSGERFKPFSKDNSEPYKLLDRKEYLHKDKDNKFLNNDNEAVLAPNEKASYEYKEYGKVKLTPSDHNDGMQLLNQVYKNKKEFTPKEKSNKVNFFKRTDSEHTHENRMYNRKPLSIERLASICCFDKLL